MNNDDDSKVIIDNPGLPIKYGWCIAQEYVGTYFISTIKLALNFDKQGEYETMVFSKDVDELQCERYNTIEEARQGHDAIANEYRRLNDDR